MECGVHVDAVRLWVYVKVRGQLQAEERCKLRPLQKFLPEKAPCSAAGVGGHTPDSARRVDVLIRVSEKRQCPSPISPDGSYSVSRDAYYAFKRGVTMEKFSALLQKVPSTKVANEIVDHVFADPVAAATLAMLGIGSTLLRSFHAAEPFVPSDERG